jgi:hypothetical protein
MCCAGGKMTKALHVCRHLHAAGWRVVLLETHKYWHVGARLSASVAAFHTVPVPEQDAARYVRAIAGVCAGHVRDTCTHVGVQRGAGGRWPCGACQQQSVAHLSAGGRVRAPTG